ncbi:MAG: HD domain-containing protein [Micrococcaceae bacterium]
MNDETILKAKELAIKAHKGQVDKSGIDYITHPARVAKTLSDEGADPETVAVGWLHDVVEDTEITLEDLRKLGFSQSVVAGVDAMTKRKGEPLKEYLTRVKANPIAHQVKLADVKDNTNPTRVAALKDEKTKEKLAKKYKFVKEFLKQ